MTAMNADQELQAKLKSSNPVDRMLAVMRLSESPGGGRALSPQLVETLKDKDFGVRTSAAAALVRVGDDAVPHLERLLDDPHILVRVNGACNLLKIRSHPEAVSVIKDALRADQDDKIKRNAFYDLSNMGVAAVKALPAILLALDDPDHTVRERAFDVLQILDRWPTRPCPSCSNCGEKQDKEEVIFTLGCMGPAAAKAVPELIEALREKATSLRRACRHSPGRHRPGRPRCRARSGQGSQQRQGRSAGPGGRIAGEAGPSHRRRRSRFAETAQA